ncbi:hypothetical protein DEAC_c40400 [Desulfosporosinus acididurans]|uniref:Uncharacterized protein n=1 Tax=Desulfosporosinus acididurans TaxID=476652 RepID=A0A0J1IHB1_9FIRM|nr:hypothetical protein [Desulfosporosinus acididurans]KLU64046.1 hypothetical protein DEAC_c40400 [Desulfosporosinus acididurans]
MKIDIQEIVNAKIKDMEENRVVEIAIEQTLEKSVIKAVVDALESWDVKDIIKTKVKKEVSGVINDIGFTAYNSFIADKVKSIAEGVCQKDIIEKIQKTFDELLVIKRDSIKLSEVCDEYRKWICEDVEESEKYNLEHYWVRVEESNYGWLTFKFGREKPEYSSRRSSENSIEFTVHKNHDNKEIGWISSVYIDGYGIDGKLNFGRMSSIESLLVNLAYNKTPIVIDVESEDDLDSSFDVDI